MRTGMAANEQEISMSPKPEGDLLIPMPDTTTPLPLSRSRAEQIFPVLTAAQISRIAAIGRMRAIQSGEVLVEQGDGAIPIFVVVSGELEAVLPTSTTETLITVFRAGQFTGEVNTLSGRRALARLRARQPGAMIELSRENVLALVQTDAELSDSDARFYSSPC
jgi:thioredoxin reductase (NADPH)